MAVRVELEEALDRIEEIRVHLAGTETFRGYRAVAVALTGLAAAAAALVQPGIVGEPARDPARYVIWWSFVAVLCAVCTGAQILYQYIRCHSRLQRSTTRTVVGQLVPGVVAGASITWSLGIRHPEQAVLLPALWAVIISLGIFASRRFLPRAIGWVGLYYLLAGSLIFEFLPGPAALSPWVMGVTFGLGQTAAAIVLHWNLERDAEEEDI
jgi:hypothetical protein